MSAHKRSPYFISPLKVECDQKDIIIGHLKDEVYMLRKNEEDYIRLQDQYRVLDQRYRILNEDKIRNDSEFKDRHEHSLRSICQLKNEIDALRADLRQKNLETSDLQSDENVLVGQLDQRIIEIQKLKNQLNSMLADNEELLNERMRLDQVAMGVRKDNDILITNAKDLELNNNCVRKKIDDTDSLLNKLKTEEALLKDRIINYENENNGLDADVSAVCEDVATLEANISAAQNEHVFLQTEIAQSSALADKFKSQSMFNHKSTQSQVIRNNDLTKTLGQADNTLKLRINQVEQGHKEVAKVRNDNDNLTKANSQLRDDIEYCRRHLENISLLNSDLVANLEKYSSEDQVVSNLIDRKGRVMKCRNRIEEAGVLVNRSLGLQGSGRKSKLIY